MFELAIDIYTEKNQNCELMNPRTYVSSLIYKSSEVEYNPEIVWLMILSAFTSFILFVHPPVFLTLQSSS